MRFPATPGWGRLVLHGPSPILAEGPGGCSPSFLAGVCLWWSWVLFLVWGGGPWFVCVRVVCVLWCVVCVYLLAGVVFWACCYLGATAIPG